MTNYLENYLSVQDDDLYHIKTLQSGTTKALFFDETYQSVGKGKTNLEQPFAIPNAEKFVVKGLKIRFFNLLNLDPSSKLPCFYLSFYLGETELFNLHSVEFYPSLIFYTLTTSTEGTLSTRNVNLFPIGENLKYSFGFTKGLEITILKNVSFRVELTKIENLTTNTTIGIFLVGTFYRTITG